MPSHQLSIIFISKQTLQMWYYRRIPHDLRRNSLPGRLRGPFVPVGATNRDKRPPFCLGWCLQPGQKAPVPPSPAGPASRWTRDKSHLLSRAQRLPGQIAWNKGLFCSSDWRFFIKILHWTNINDVNVKC